MISSRIGHSFDPLILKVYRVLFMGRTVSPSFLTVLGAFAALVASLFIAFGHPVAGAVALLASGLFDLMDGALARSTSNVTLFGGFLDSVLDRYSDLMAMGGILVYFLRRDATPDVIITFIAAMGAAIIPYAKARADAAGLASNTGLLERPERLVILLCGLLFGLLHYAMIILAVLTHVTAFQRILYAKRSAGTGRGPEITPLRD